MPRALPRTFRAYLTPGPRRQCSPGGKGSKSATAAQVAPGLGRPRGAGGTAWTAGPAAGSPQCQPLHRLVKGTEARVQPPGRGTLSGEYIHTHACGHGTHGGKETRCGMRRRHLWVVPSLYLCAQSELPVNMASVISREEHTCVPGSGSQANTWPAPDPVGHATESHTGSPGVTLLQRGPAAPMTVTCSKLLDGHQREADEGQRLAQDLPLVLGCHLQLLPLTLGLGPADNGIEQAHLADAQCVPL